MAETALGGVNIPRTRELDRRTEPTETRQQTPSEEAPGGWRETAILMPLALLLPRAVLPGGVAPLGLSFLLALVICGVDRLQWYVLAAFLSQLTALPYPLALSYAPVYLLLIYLGRRWPLKPAWLVGSVALLMLIGPIPALWLGVMSAVPWARVVIETATACLFAFIFARAVPVLRRAPLLGEDHLFLALLPLSLAVYGLAEIEIFGLNIAAVAAIFLIMLLGYLGGPGLGAATGTLLAALPGTGYGSWPIACGLACGGLAGGLMRRSGRPGVILGFCAGFSLPASALFAQSALLLPTIGQALAGTGLFLCLPGRSLKQLSATIPADHSWAAAKKTEQVRLRALLAERVEDIAGIFSEMSKAFEVHDEEYKPGPDLYSLLDQVVRRNCQECSGFQACWRQNFYASYRELFDLLALAEMNGFVRPEDLRGRLASACFQRKRLIETVEGILAGLRSEHAVRHQSQDNMDFVAEQLDGVANIMAGLAREMHRDVEFRLEVEERLRIAFNRLGLSVESLSVLDYGRDMLEVRIRKHGCLNYLECQYLLCPLVSRVLGHSFRVWEKKCPGKTREGCSFTLVPAGDYQVSHAVARLSKDPEHCGDSHAIVQTKDGRCALILSDGMGTGAKAARESQATVNLLAQLLASGLKEEFTVEMINSVLMLRTPEERFATIDVALIDLFRGEAELIKVGAAPSYIKHGREVTAIRASTPPAGILQKIEVNRQRRQLAPGDYLVLASDGVFAGELDPAAAEDWVERALSRVEVAGPQSMVDFLLQIARSNMGREIDDDVTVIAAQLLPAAP